jgi:hypothetical protein
LYKTDLLFPFEYPITMDNYINSQLRSYGARISGSYQRRMERLRRFADNQRGRFNQSERSAAWALDYLRNYKTETFQVVDIPVANGDYDYCVREREGTVYYVQLTSDGSVRAPKVPPPWT